MSSFVPAPGVSQKGAVGGATGLVGAPTAAAGAASFAIPARRRGVRPWIHGLSLVSTGCPDLDKLLGGGLPLGSVLLCEEDAHGTHARGLLQCWLGDAAANRPISDGAEGGGGLVESGHVPVLAGADGWLPLMHYATTMPGLRQRGSERKGKGTEAAAGAAGSQDGDGLRIAWQYRKYLDGGAGAAGGIDGSAVAMAAEEHRLMSGVTASPADVLGSAGGLGRGLSGGIGGRIGGSSFSPASGAAHGPGGGGVGGVRGSGKTMLDFATPCGDDAVASVKTVHVAADGGDASTLADFLARIAARVEEASAAGNVARVAVVGLLSPDWALPGSVEERHRELLRFLHGLRALCRRTDAAAFVSVPSRSWKASALLRRAEHASDVVLEVTAFEDGGPDAATEFEGYTGTVTLRRQQHLNALTGVTPTARTWLFKRDRRRITMEPLHLPPGKMRACETVKHPLIQRLWLVCCAEDNRSMHTGSTGPSAAATGGAASVAVGGAPPARRKPALQAGMACSSTGGEGTSSLDF